MTTDQLFTWPNVRGIVKTSHSPPVEAIEREARSAAHAEGLAAGLAEGRRQAEAELVRARKELDALRTALESRADRLAEDYAHRLAPFMLDCFEALLGASAKVCPEVFANLLRSCLDVGGGGEVVTVSAHPELAKALSASLDQAVEPDPQLAPWTVVVSGDRLDWSASVKEEFRQLLEQALDHPG